MAHDGGHGYPALRLFPNICDLGCIQASAVAISCNSKKWSCSIGRSHSCELRGYPLLWYTHVTENPENQTFWGYWIALCFTKSNDNSNASSHDSNKTNNNKYTPGNQHWPSQVGVGWPVSFKGIPFWQGPAASFHGGTTRHWAKRLLWQVQRSWVHGPPEFWKCCWRKQVCSIWLKKKVDSWLLLNSYCNAAHMENNNTYLMAGRSRFMVHMIAHSWRIHSSS